MLKPCRPDIQARGHLSLLHRDGTTDVQSYSYKRICQPVLTYGLECINMSQCQIGKVNSVQGKLMNQGLGLSKRSHNTEITTIKLWIFTKYIM